ncbi:hypothetical protein FIBSPDRAFT_538955 [Athelia psychrophila]|uniref:Uncharacterized protein n=1 Tax=Athelia psychrophila TaxID=1759441 RepID=A0A166J252_9AGAM|nr:hypothetical protein FIBSPDRAFT_538955 [Fibularhizoctonia sp. CBS 109695]
MWGEGVLSALIEQRDEEVLPALIEQRESRILEMHGCNRSHLSNTVTGCAIEPAVTESIRRKPALRGTSMSVQKVVGMSREAKQRARMNLVGHEVDTASESEGEHGAQSEEI